MGKEKGGFLTPKAIANRIKSKGLQKLRWYCQMCQKQCRDENGFKCHTMSESHQRQLLLVAENPNRFVDDFSGEFAETFLQHLKRRFGTKRVLANQVYQEYITDRHHTHMNSTKWLTLTGFVKWLGKTGKAVADETEKGWFITYIDRDPETLRRQEEVVKKKKMDKDDEERMAAFIEKQIQRAAGDKTDDGEAPDAAEQGLQRDDEEEKVVFSLGGAAGKKAEQPSTSRLAPVENPFKVPAVPAAAAGSMKDPAKGKDGTKRKSALDEIIEMEQKKKKQVDPSKLQTKADAQSSRKDYWLHPGIVVKVVTKKLGEKYFKKKGVIRDVIDKYAAVVKMTDSGDKIKVDQTHLETVIPAIGKDVLIVNGEYRNRVATLLELNEKRFSCTLKIKSGSSKGRVLDGVQYEDISKLCTDSS